MKKGKKTEEHSTSTKTPSIKIELVDEPRDVHSDNFESRCSHSRYDEQHASHSKDDSAICHRNPNVTTSPERKHSLQLSATIHKCNSEGSLCQNPPKEDDKRTRNEDDSDIKTSKMDSLLRKTRHALSSSNISDKKTTVSFSKSSADDNSALLNKNDQHPHQPRLGAFNTSSFKVSLNGVRQKIKGKLNERLGNSTDVENYSDNEQGQTETIPKSGLNFLPEIRNRISSRANALLSPKVKRRTPPVITQEEKERRDKCKTRIIEL